MALNTQMDEFASLLREQAGLIELLDRRAALRAALELLDDGGDVAWMAEPCGGQAGDANGYLVLRHVRRDRTGLLRGLQVPSGLGLTGKVHGSGRPAWVDDYFRATEITHTFDDQIKAEDVR